MNQTDNPVLMVDKLTETRFPGGPAVHHPVRNGRNAPGDQKPRQGPANRFLRNHNDLYADEYTQRPSGDP